MNPHLKNNQIPETRYLNSNNTPINRPATNGAFLYKLLTLHAICNYLTKVNKIKHTILNINNLEYIHIDRKTVPKPALLNKKSSFHFIFLRFTFGIVYGRE